MSGRNSDRFRQVGNILGWLLVPFAGFTQYVGSRRILPGTEVVTVELAMFLVMATVTGPWWWSRRRELNVWARLLLWGFAGLVAYSAGSLLLHAPPTVATSGVIVVPKALIALPLVTALASALAGVGMVLSSERRKRPTIVLTAGAVALVVALLGWPRQVAVHNSLRLATALGGSAVIHVFFLLVSAVGLGLYLQRTRSRIALAVASVAVLAVLATGSRAGLLNLLAWTVLLFVGWLINDSRSRVRVWPLLAGLAFSLIVAASLPGTRRILEFSDPKRSANLASSIQLWLGDWQSVVFGVGPGQVWPWFAFDTGFIGAPGTRLIGTSAGDVLLSPHSTLLAIVVELGVVGGLFLILLVIVLLKLWLTSHGDSLRFCLSSAMLATMIGFALDTYLLKNFGVSMWWWLSVALCSSFSELPETRSENRTVPL